MYLSMGLEQHGLVGGRGLIKAIFSASIGSIGILLYSEYASMKDSSLCPPMVSTIWSILG